MEHFQSPPPGRFRWVLLGMLLVISMVTYLDRVNISIAGKYIMSAYGISSVDMGKIFSAFVFGYALFQVPGGWLGDRFGPRKLLAAAMLWWSLATALTAQAPHLFAFAGLGVIASFALVRFVIGAGEAAAYPNFNLTIAHWMTSGERALANSLVLGASGFGAAITPPLIGWLMSRYGWQESFYVCGALGIVVAAVWYRYSADRPEQSPRVTAAELAVIHADSNPKAKGDIRKVSFKALLRNRNVWLLIASNFLFGYVAYIYLTWFYLYLVDVRHFSVLKSSFYGTLPFVAITVMTPLGGSLSDRLCAKLGKRYGRSLVVMAGMTLTALCVSIGGRAVDPYFAIFSLSLGAGFLYFSLGPYWATVIDIAKGNAGVVSGMMNTGGNTGGTISPTLTPFVASMFGWSAALDVAAAAAFVGGMLWLFINADSKVEELPGMTNRAEDFAPSLAE